MVYFIILILMTIVGASAAFFLKKSSASEGLKKLLLNKFLYIGGGLYFISALMNIYVLRHLDYSVVLPLTSITYIWTMVISYYKLSEKITVKKIIGICSILIGAVCVAI
jgi:drug/metabolite transporter (DMT)-like permease